MIELYTFPEAFGLRNVSPFCLRVEMALTHLDMPFDIILEHNPGKGPKGKLPFIVDGGQTIADSEIIYQHLEQKSNGGLFGGIDAVDRGRGYAYTRLVDDHLYWMMVASRWLDAARFDNVRTGFFQAFPPVLRTVIGTVARSQVRKTYNLHGLGRHTLDEQRAFARRDLQALVDGLDGGRYIVAGRMTVFDFTVASLLAGLIDNQPATWISELAREYPALADYAEGIQAEVGVYARSAV